MVQFAVETLNDQLDEYLNLARKGEKVLLTSRNRPVAVLSPIDEEIRQGLKLVDAGVAEWTGGKPRPPANPPKTKGRATSEIVLEDRR